MVSDEEQHSLFRNVGEGGPQRRAGVQEYRAERPQPAGAGGGPLQRVPRPD